MKIGRRGVAGWVLGFAFSLLLVPSAWAWAGGIVLVTQPSAPLTPDELAPLLDSLQLYGFDASPSQIRRAVGPRFPMAAQGPDASIASLAETLEQANTMWLEQPPLQKLLPVLEAAAELARRNPVLLIHRPSLRSRYHQILISLALAYQRAGDLRRTEESMTELIRTAPTRIVTRSQDGPAAEQLYVLTRANLHRLGRGALEVRIDQSDVQAYLDEQIVRTNTPIPDLAPGLHRLVLIDPLDRVRLHEVVVASERTTVVEIVWSLDTAVSAGPRWVELTFQTETDYARRGELARELARGADAAAFVLIDVVLPRDGLRRVIASLRDARSNRTIREASATAWSEQTMRALGRFIADGTPSPWIVIHVSGQQQAAPELSEPRAAPKPAPRRIRKYVATAAAGTALVGGATLLYLSPLRLCDQEDRDPAGRCPTYIPLEPHGFISLGLGAALGGLAGYWWYADRAPRPRVGVQLDPAQRGGSVVATWLLP